jgi:hypothetical protein
MVRKWLTSALVALVVGSSLAAVPVRAAAGEEKGRSTNPVFALAGKVRYGPYVTIRRANEVANYFRRLGYNARIIYLGTLKYREYAVDVW